MDEEPQSPTSKSGVRRPMNAFLIFCKRHRSLVRERNPRLDNRSVTRILGELWAKLPLEEKSTYTSLANEYKEAFLKANPDYKWFNPEKNSTPNNRDKPSTRPTNSLTSYTGQIPHTDDNGPTSPSHAPITSQLSTVIMENKAQGGIPFSTSLSAPQGTSIAQGIPIFPISMATQPASLSGPQPVTSMTQAITTIAMVAGQPVMVSQTPLMVSLPQQQIAQQQIAQQQIAQQQLTPVTMVTTHLPPGTINSTATTVGQQVTKLAGSTLTVSTGSEVSQNERSVGLFELAQMCSTEHAKINAPADRPNQQSTFNPIATMQNNVAAVATGTTSGATSGPSQEPQDKPRLDSKVLQGQVKQALGFQFGDLAKFKGQIQNPAGLNHVLDYSLKKNKEAQMARNILRQDAAKSLGIDPVTTTKTAESLPLSKLVLDHVIEAMYSHETVKSTASASAVTQTPSIGPEPQNRSKLMLTFGEIQERVIRSAVEQSDYNDLLRLKSNPQITIGPTEGNIFKEKDSKPATITSDANKENKAENKVELKTESNENQKESHERNYDDCDAKRHIPIKKRKPRAKDVKTIEAAQESENSSDRGVEDTQSSADDFDLDPNDLDAGVRKSKRSNRGRRYQELIEQGYLQPARDKTRRGDDSVLMINPVPQPMISDAEPSPNLVRTVVKTQFQVAAQDDTENPEAPPTNESEAGSSLAMEAPPDDDQPYSRKRTYSETDIGNRRTRKRYKTGDFDLDAQIASLPICHIDEVTRRGSKGKSLKIRHHSENSTLNKFAKPADINLLNVAELRGVLRPRSQSMSQAIVGSARRKAPKMSIVRFIQAIRNPNASVVPLLSPVSASSIPPWSDSSSAEKATEKNESNNSPDTQIQTPADGNNVRGEAQGPKENGATETQINENKSNMAAISMATSGSNSLQEALGKVTCVNVTAVSELRFEKGSEKTPALVTCQ